MNHLDIILGVLDAEGVKHENQQEFMPCKGFPNGGVIKAKEIYTRRSRGQTRGIRMSNKIKALQILEIRGNHLHRTHAKDLTKQQKQILGENLCNFYGDCVVV